MSEYLKPEMEVIYFKENLVITTSGGGLIEGDVEIKDDSDSANKLWGWE